MEFITASRARASLAQTLAWVVDDAEPVIVTRANHEPVVIIAKRDYDSLMETVYLLRSPANARRLLGAIERLEHDGD